MPTLATLDALWVNGVEYDAAEHRLADAALVAQAGIGYGLTVTVNGADQVTVQPGAWVISGEATLAGSGVYRGGLGAAATVALDARDATYSRVDLVVARQYDPAVVPAHEQTTATVEVITGVPAASPVAPPLPALAIELARITVPVNGGAAASVNSTQRKFAATVTGGAAFVPLTLAGGWTARAGDYVPAYRVGPDGVVELRGGLQKSTAILQGDAPFTLPTAARPAAAVHPPVGFSRTVNNGVVTGRLDIMANGTTLLYLDDTVDGNWFALDGIRFYKS